MSFPNLKGGDIVHIRARVAKVDGGVLVEPIHWLTAGSGLSNGKPHLVYQENILTVEHRPFVVGELVTIPASRHVWKIAALDGDRAWLKTDSHFFNTEFVANLKRA
jgi:hypothetical protein